MAENIRFGSWKFDPGSNRLANANTHCTLQPRVAALLEYFLRHPNEVHSHEQLIQAVWGDRIVSDDSVRHAVSTLRHALAVDDSDRFIKTVCKKGYLARFPRPASDAVEFGTDPGADGVVASGDERRSWHVLFARRRSHLMWTTALLLFLALVLWAVIAPGDHLHRVDGIASLTLSAPIGLAAVDVSGAPRCCRQCIEMSHHSGMA